MRHFEASPVSAVLGWNSVFVYVTNCSWRFRFGRRLLDRVMCISPSPLIFTPSTSAATLSVPSVAVMFILGEVERKAGGIKGEQASKICKSKDRRTEILTE